MPARSISRWETISASLGSSRRIGRKYRESLMAIVLGGCAGRLSDVRLIDPRGSPLKAPLRRYGNENRTGGVDSVMTIAQRLLELSAIEKAWTVSVRSPTQRWRAVQVWGGREVSGAPRPRS